jgi:hypothetical protein
MLKLFALCLTISLLATSATAAAPVKARVPSGIGIVLLQNGSAEKPSPLAIYKEPSLGRIIEIAAGRLPSLSHSIAAPDGTVTAIVTSKKSGWYRIIYDDGEREGWIKGRSSDQFYRWEELLRDRPVSLIGGLRKEYYLLRGNPDSSAESINPLGKGSCVTSLDVEGDWIRIFTDSRTEGWIRWRDENCRLVIAVKL